MPQMESQSNSTSEGSEDPGCTRRAVNEGAREDPSYASEESSSTSSEASEDESSETSSEDSQSEKSESPKDLEKPECSHPSSKKDVQRYIYFRTPTPSPSATTQSNQPDPEAMVIETEVHTSNPSQQATSEDLANVISTQLPKSTTNIPTHDDASVAHLSPFRLSRRSYPTQGHWLTLQAQGLTCLDRKLNSHIHFQSYESEKEDLVENRTLRDASPEHRGPSRSPSRDNIQPSLKEGSSRLEDKLATCVVTNVPIFDFLTKSEFQRFCEEVRSSMNEHNFQRIDYTETSALRSENNNLRAEVSTLKTQLLDSTHRIQGLEQEMFQQKVVSSLEIAALKAQIATLQTQSFTVADVQRELKELREEVVATRSTSLSSEQLASISDLIKSTIQASLPTTTTPSEIPIPPFRTAEVLITKSDLPSFKDTIMSRMLTYSSKISTIAQKQVKATLEVHRYNTEDHVAEILGATSEAITSIQQVALDPKGKGLAAAGSPKYKRKFGGDTCSAAAKRFREATGHRSEAALSEPANTSGSDPPTSTNRSVQEKEPERNTTSADDKQILQAPSVPVILLPSTSAAPIIPRGGVSRRLCLETLPIGKVSWHSHDRGTGSIKTPPNRFSLYFSQKSD
ncbi:hypothetical protein L6452_36088 [Arctium lappa]|uniref:Uncharacterized protein n=1 Tax=Arctium lappa TaxID=4217 RepID=A0ACB8Y9L3_ARCLA|nr:hypothetical protein L6452_36088 [Arctium lappa]